jgi:hypothetical protein
MSQETTHCGGCHCGAVRIEFRSAKSLAPRACGCSFCRRIGGRWVSDVEGQAMIDWDHDREPTIYRFGTGTADFVICSRCGVVVAAVDESEDGRICVLNLNAFDDPHADIAAIAMDFEDESIEQRSARRRRVWTPATLSAKDRS